MIAYSRVAEKEALMEEKAFRAHSRAPVADKESLMEESLQLRGQLCDSGLPDPGGLALVVCYACACSAFSQKLRQ